MRYYNDDDGRTDKRIENRVLHTKLTYVIVYAIEAYGLSNIFSENIEIGADNLGKVIMICAFSFIALYILQVFFLEKYYIYLSITSFHGALLGSWLFFVLLGMYLGNNKIELNPILSKFIYLLCIVISIAVKIFVYNLNHYDVHGWSEKDAFTKVVSIVFMYLTLLITCGVFGYNILTLIIAGVLTGIAMFLIKNRSLEKDREKEKKNWEQQRQEAEDILKEEAREEAAQEAARRFKDEYKKSMGWGGSETNNEQSQQSDYEKKFNERWSTSSSTMSGGRVYFKNCNTLEELEARHRSLAKAYHPDSNAGDTESYQEMQEEYERIKKEIGH